MFEQRHQQKQPQSVIQRQPDDGNDSLGAVQRMHEAAGAYSGTMSSGIPSVQPMASGSKESTGKQMIRMQPEEMTQGMFSQSVYLPSSYDAETDSVLLYLKRPGTNPKTTKDMDFVTEIKGVGYWSFAIPDGGSMAEVYMFTKSPVNGTKPIGIEQLLVSTKLVFKLSPKGIVKGDNWEGSAYQKVYNNLNGKSETYKDIVSDYTGAGARYNLEMNYSKTPGQTGTGNTTTQDLYGADPSQDPSPVKGSTVSTHFNPDKDTKVTNNATITMNDLGRALTIVHEGVHAEMMIDLGYEANFGPTHHNEMSGSAYRSRIVKSLKEFVEGNKFSVTDFELNLISWYGLLRNKTNIQNFQAWVTADSVTDSLAKEALTLDITDGTSVQAWIDKVNEKIETIIYNSSSQPDRYMVK